LITYSVAVARCPDDQHVKDRQPVPKIVVPLTCHYQGSAAVPDGYSRTIAWPGQRG
jgi:hypothetical protein